VLLHGGVLAGGLCWRQQVGLADHFGLEIVDRAGCGRSQQVSLGEDLDADAPLVAGLLTEGHIWWAIRGGRWPRCWPPPCGPRPCGR
jgi:hypothetical protein